VELLTKNNNYYLVQDYKSWFDAQRLSGTGPSNADETAIKREKCTAYEYGCLQTRGYYLYPCTFLNSAEQLNAIPYDERNHLDLSAHDLSITKVKTFIASQFPGCAWCNGRAKEQVESLTIPAAVQLSEPVSYRRY
jgi:hypothetical protein